MFPRGGDENWGKGAYTIPDSIRVNLYLDTNDNLFGSLRKDDFKLSLYDKEGNLMPDYPRGDIEWIGHTSCELLKFKDCKNDNYVKVNWKHSPPGMFLKKIELESLGIKPFTYREYLYSDDIPSTPKSMREWANTGVNLERSCLNLREKPSIKSEKIECVPGNDWPSREYNHMKVLDVNGDWAKVKVTYYCIGEDFGDEAAVGCTGKILRTSIGWVKAMDDNGFPNIWFSMTSY